MDPSPEFLAFLAAYHKWLAARQAARPELVEGV